MSHLSSRFFALIGTLSFVATAGVASAAEPLAAADASREAGLVLAAGFIATALVLRRRVNTGMWASRERAFTRRTQRAARHARHAGPRGTR